MPQSTFKVDNNKMQLAKNHTTYLLVINYTYIWNTHCCRGIYAFLVLKSKAMSWLSFDLTLP